MTNTGDATTPAGWYTDPAGSGHLRWWDGATWTAHLAPQPTPEPVPTPVAHTPILQTPVVQAPVFATAQQQSAVFTPEEQPYTPFQGAWNTNSTVSAYSLGAADDFARPAQWNTVGAWLLAFSGLLSLAAVAVSTSIPGSALTTANGVGRILGASAVVFLISLLFAEADRRKLRSLGYLKIPSLWWMLLAPPLVYLILRTVNVWGEVRKGIAPLITYVVANVLGGVAAGVIAALLVPGLLLGSTSSSQFASSLQTGLDEKGGHFTVSCPATIPTIVGSTFACTATDAAGAQHVLSIQVVTGSDGKPTVKLLSVTPAITG